MMDLQVNLGHTIIIPDGRLHEGTGKHGSLESYASATGVRLTAMEMLEKSKEPSLLRDVPKEELDSKEVYEAAIHGDKLALKKFLNLPARYSGWPWQILLCFQARRQLSFWWT